MRPHVFRSKVGSHFPYFWLYACFKYCFFLYVEMFHFLQIWEGVVIYNKLISYWIKSTPARILFPDQYRTLSEILLEELFIKQHRLNRQLDSLYLDSIIATSSRVFSPRPLLYTIVQYGKIPQTNHVLNKLFSSGFYGSCRTSNMWLFIRLLSPPSIFIVDLLMME